MKYKITKSLGIPRYNFNDLFGNEKIKHIDYKDGIFLIKTKSYYFLDYYNEKIFGPFKEANMFKNEFARIVDFDNNVKYMRKDGSFNKYSKLNGSRRNYSSNKLISKNNSEFYIYDNNGRLINKLEAKNVKDFSGPYAVSEFEDNIGTFFKYINSFGNITDMRKYEYLSDFNENISVGKPFQDFKAANSIIYHIFDDELNIISKFKSAGVIGNKFVNNLCIITNWDKDDNLKFGYVNDYGEYQIPCKYDMAYNFSDGLARVKLDGKYGYIDENDNLVIHTMFDEASDFINDLAVVKYNNLWHIIDKEGKFKLFGYKEKLEIKDDMIIFLDNTYLPIKDLNKIYKVEIKNSENKIEYNFDSEEKRDKFYNEQNYQLNKVLSEVNKFRDDSFDDLFSQTKRTIKTKMLINK